MGSKLYLMVLFLTYMNIGSPFGFNDYPVISNDLIFFQEEKEGSDQEFKGDIKDAVDQEDTIAEQEKHEKKNYKDELQDLQDEGEMSIEELAAKYAGAYDSDFEMPKDSEGSEEEDSDDDDEEDEDASNEDSDGKKSYHD